MTIIYRISDAGYAKDKPDYITNENCLRNAALVFKKADWIIIADNCKPETMTMIREVTNSLKPKIEEVSFGSGAATFRLAYELALKTKDEAEIIYFIENDYLHIPGAYNLILEGFKELNPHFMTLYDHPDKYMNKEDGGNPFVSHGGEVSRVMKTKNSWWKLTNSTTMTFAARVATLKESKSKINPFITGTYPEDFNMFIALRASKKSLLSSIPSHSTHGESAWLSEAGVFINKKEFWRTVNNIASK